MRAINVIKVKNGVINDIRSFGISNDSNPISETEKAEKYFTEEALKYGADANDIDAYIEDGCYEGGNFSINIVWSSIEF